MAYEAHLRGRDVFNKVDGEFDFKTYSDNFKNNVLDTDFVKGDISRFGESLQGKGKVTFRTGQPQGIQGSKLQEDLASHKKALTSDELQKFDERKWISDYRENLETVFHEPKKGFFGQTKLDPTDPMYEYKLGQGGGELSFEGVGSRYTHQVPVTDASGKILSYQDVEGSKLGTAAWEATKTTAASTVGGGAEEGTGSAPLYVASVPDPTPLEPRSTIDVTTGRGFPNTTVQLGYLDGIFEATNYDWGQQLNGGRYFPHILSLNYSSPQQQQRTMDPF